MVKTPLLPLSLVEFLARPETQPATEYIDGNLQQKPMPQGEHSTLQTELAPAINAVLKPTQTARAFVELRCTFSGRSIVPDIAVFTWPRIPRTASGKIANRFDLVPDWTIEILSPDQSQTLVTKKILHCLRQGCQMGWLLNPKELSIFTFRPDSLPEVHDTMTEVVTVPDFAAAVQLTVGDIFGWLNE